MNANAESGFDSAALDATLRTLTTRLLEARTAAGHWEGHLASSALATATAVGALVLSDPARHAAIVREGVAWLAAHQNPDGGWGDTTRSATNISTTALGWAACSMAQAVDSSAACAAAIRRAEIWLRHAVSAAAVSAPGSPDRVGHDSAEGHGDQPPIANRGDVRGTVARAGGGSGPDVPFNEAAPITSALSPDALALAIARRYGKDRTFSVPILTVLAIAGKLGDDAGAWRRVPQLPFELAACPHQWFQWLRLPVVSYALPALIAIGQARHHRRPTRNPLTRAARAAARARTLRTLRSIQPESGGYLEAVPLTAFVVMSLVAAEQTTDPVVAQGVEFLLASRRADGSWPIDTNLATWVTTLSINALAHQAPNAVTTSVKASGQPGAAGSLPPRRATTPLFLSRHNSAGEGEGAGSAGEGEGAERVREELPRLADWLLKQQYRVEHPYTHAAPGGWAWTDLSGGVPDADDTPGALLALAHLRALAGAKRGAPDDRDAGLDADSVRDSVALGVRWLLDLQNRDGGMPTFCRGWGALPFDRSSQDLTAHALLAWEVWRRELPADLGTRVSGAMDRAVAFLARTQRPDGAWVPLWFGNERAPGDENPTYGTARVLIALAQLADRPTVDALVARGRDWLLAAQNPDGGWGGSRGITASIEETALAVDALAAVISSSSVSPDISRNVSQNVSRAALPHSAPDSSPDRLPDPRAALTRGVAWLIDATQCGTQTPASPIGFYFAKLWYYEELYPLIFATSALGRARLTLCQSVTP